MAGGSRSPLLDVVKNPKAHAGDTLELAGIYWGWGMGGSGKKFLNTARTRSDWTLEVDEGLLFVSGFPPGPPKPGDSVRVKVVVVPADTSFYLLIAR